jgi:hypothetical protein
MKNSKIMRSLASMSLVIALCAVGSRAADYTLPAGSFTVLTSGGGVCNNPNGFPVVMVGSSQLPNYNAGFLLNGSESASNWLKTLQDACWNNRKVVVYIDDNFDHGYCGQIAENGYTAGAYKILSIVIMP